jgi:toxin ParE1/3/4
MPPTLAPSFPPKTSRPKLQDGAPKSETSGPENRLETRLAAQGRRDSRAGIARDNPVAVHVLDELISEKTARLTEHPALGRPGRGNGLRELVVHPNYILPYSVVRKTVRFLRVLHTSRQEPEGGHASS